MTLLILRSVRIHYGGRVSKDGVCGRKLSAGPGRSQGRAAPFTPPPF